MRLTQMVEALLFASDAPLTAADLARIDERLDEDTVIAVIEELRAEYDQAERSFQIFEVAGGYQLLTRPEFVAVLERYQTVPHSARLSVPALEVLAIIAYRQPIGRMEVEEIRGVQSAAVLRTLQDRELIEPVGRGEGLGRPMLYGTTRRFLEHFGFGSLEDMPRPDELPVVLRVPRSLTPPEEREAFAVPGVAAEPSPLSVEAAQEAEELHLRVHPARGHAAEDGEEAGQGAPDSSLAAVAAVLGESADSPGERNGDGAEWTGENLL
jgi:segregation and condensation protein B